MHPLRFSILLLAFSLMATLAAPAEHPPGCADMAGTVSRALMERPLGLTDAAGHMHQQVSTRSAEAQAYYDQGIAFLSSYVWIEAARSFNEALRRDPDLAMAHLGLAKAYYGAQSSADAWDHLRRAQALAATTPVTAKERAWIALGVQQMEAIEAPEDKREEKHRAYKRAIEALIQMDPSDAHAWVLRGNAEEAGAWGRGQAGGVASIAFYETALQRDPHDLAAHHYLVHSYENIGDYARAAEHGRAYAEAAPGVGHAQHMYAHVLPRLGRWQEALEQLLKADRVEREWYAREDIAPGEDWHHGHNLHLLGVVYAHLGRDADAEKALREAFALPPRGMFAGVYGSPFVQYLLVRQRWNEALQAAQQLEKEPSAFAHLAGAALAGEAQLGLGRRGDAAQSLARAQRAQAALLQEVKDTPYEGFVPGYAGPYVETLAGELALGGAAAAAGEKQLLSMADAISSSPRLDAWADGLFRLQRVAAAAARAGRLPLAAAIRERIRRIDPAAK